jgi:nucleoside-diphosphate-sugar epimerase
MAVPVQALQIGDLAVCGIPFEAFVEIGLDLKKRSPFPRTMVIASDIRPPTPGSPLESGPFKIGDVLQPSSIDEIIKKHSIDTIFHMAAILSATGEQHPQQCWNVNMCGSIKMLELALKHNLARIIIPSSIAVWGPGVPLENTPQESVLKPTTMYGITKVCGELLGDYYVRRFGLDVRGLRYPGIISYETPPGGGTTDYAVAIFYEAVDKAHYTCFVREDTRLPMMYMPDAVNATLKLAEADFSLLKHHSDFNVAAMSFTAGELASAIKKHLPQFEVTFEPDYHQAIADSWPRSVDDSAARQEWGWRHEWDLDRMTRDMLQNLQRRKSAHTLYR